MYTIALLVLLCLVPSKGVNALYCVDDSMCPHACSYCIPTECVPCTGIACNESPDAIVLGCNFNCSNYFAGWQSSANTTCQAYSGRYVCCNGRDIDSAACNGANTFLEQCPPAEACTGRVVTYRTCVPGCGDPLACGDKSLISTNPNVCLRNSAASSVACPAPSCEQTAAGMSGPTCMRYTSIPTGYCDASSNCISSTQACEILASTTASSASCGQVECVKPNICIPGASLLGISSSTLCYSNYEQGECGPNRACGPGGICVDWKANGEACINPSQCQSGFCVGNICCNSSCSETCQTCGSGLCETRPDGPHSPCPAVNCSNFVAGWTGAANTTCAAFASAAEGYCRAGQCDQSLDRCQNDNLSPLATCGSVGCKKSCDFGATKNLFSTLQDVCFTSGRQTCLANQSCNAQGECISDSLPSPPVSSPISPPVSSPPVSSPVGCVSRRPTQFPGAMYRCENGSWIIVGNVTITPQTTLNVTVTPGFQPIAVEGCVNVTSDSTLNLTIDSSLLFNSAIGQTITVIDSRSGCFSGGFRDVAVACSGDSQRCISECVTATPQVVEGRSLSVTFSFGCASIQNGGSTVPPWAIAVAVVGSLLAVAIILLVVFRVSPTLRNKIFPYREKRDGSSPSSPTIETQEEMT